MCLSLARIDRRGANLFGLQSPGTSIYCYFVGVGTGRFGKKRDFMLLCCCRESGWREGGNWRWSGWDGELLWGTALWSVGEVMWIRSGVVLFCEICCVQLAVSFGVRTAKGLFRHAYCAWFVRQEMSCSMGERGLGREGWGERGMRRGHV